MGKYEVGYWVTTKYGVAKIEKVWKLNEMITVFNVFLLNSRSRKEIYYGEIYEILYRG